ncbi:MAG TPA: coproporphyrinogen III oxidase, partial [Dongiaceae bacterium]
RVTLDGQRYATRQHRAPEAWLEKVEAAGHASGEHRPLGMEERRDELLMMGLRLNTGIARARFKTVVGREIEEVLAPESLALLVEGGFLELDAAGLRATAEGRQRLDALLPRLLG